MRSPFEREAGNGLRCIKRRGGAPLPETATRPLRNIPIPDYVNHQPVSDEVYGVFTRLFDRQPVDLKAEIEEIDESSRHWIRQRISFAAGYGGERITVLLYLPRSAQPPYQTVVQMGGAGAFYRKSSASEDDIFSWKYAEYMIRGGRAVALPIWKGSYERSDGFAPLRSSLDEYREHLQWWVTELRQTLDYLESRDDIDAQRIAFQGMSFGAMWSPLLMALEPRFRCGVVLMGGCIVIRTPATPFPPEYDILNYAPRVRAPVLMLNGRNDAIFPYEISQVPMFRAFGAPHDLKRHATFESGHSTYGWRDELFREGLDWLDTHFGPVTPASIPTNRGATP
jgi:cephalosporin-C deacetylase-like acetyl esterase